MYPEWWQPEYDWRPETADLLKIAAGEGQEWANLVDWLRAQGVPLPENEVLAGQVVDIWVSQTASQKLNPTLASQVGQTDTDREHLWQELQRTWVAEAWGESAPPAAGGYEVSGLTATGGDDTSGADAWWESAEMQEFLEASDQDPVHGQLPVLDHGQVRGIGDRPQSYLPDPYQGQPAGEGQEPAWDQNHGGDGAAFAVEMPELQSAWAWLLARTDPTVVSGIADMLRRIHGHPELLREHPERVKSLLPYLGWRGSLEQWAPSLQVLARLVSAGQLTIPAPHPPAPPPRPKRPQVTGEADQPQPKRRRPNDTASPFPKLTDREWLLVAAAVHNDHMSLVGISAVLGVSSPTVARWLTELARKLDLAASGGDVLPVLARMATAGRLHIPDRIKWPPN